MKRTEDMGESDILDLPDYEKIKKGWEQFFLERQKIIKQIQAIGLSMKPLNQRGQQGENS